jgi:ferric iron reductase protein FhuF
MVYSVAESASECLDPARAAPYLADRALLFDAETVPGIRGPNPLRDLNWDEEFPEIGEGRTVGIRRVCCLSVYLPDRPGRYCGNCPLPTHAERVALHAQRA